DPIIISLNNELSEISQKYNYLYDELSKEIELNKKLILIDPLTTAYNRKAFDTTLSEVFSLFNRYKTPFSLLLLDIDNFKQINDTYGHITGDDVLKDLVDLINENIRNTDTLYRVGGEEFIIICRNTILSDAVNLAEKLRQTIESSLNTINDNTITVSIGVTEVITKDTHNSIYKRVDDNLYDSKNKGKNRVSSDKKQANH
ncbi:GGDEF domain-containing protein, partial [Arcobacteraceae bacterium]|nr:GGDEF domain-containing protein [Arcobacteraceae bacterium]